MNFEGGVLLLMAVIDLLNSGASRMLENKHKSTQDNPSGGACVKQHQSAEYLSRIHNIMNEFIAN
jgi:hypothetical protein